MNWRTYGLVLVGVGLLTVATGLHHWVAGWVQTLMQPAELATGSVRETRSFFSALAEIGELRLRLSTLEQENAQLASQLAITREALRTSEQQQLQVAAAGGTGLAASVVLGQPSQLRDTVTVNRGSAQGVASGQPVVADGFLVGVVTDVWPDRSRVRLITDTASLIPVVLTTSRAQGLLLGDLSGLLITDVPADAEITDREVVLTSGLGDVLPADIPVGVVGERISAESEVLQRLRATSPVNLSRLNHVVIQSSP